MPTKKRTTNSALKVWKGATRRVTVTLVFKEIPDNPLHDELVRDYLLSTGDDTLAVENIEFPDGVWGDNGEDD